MKKVMLVICLVVIGTLVGCTSVFSEQDVIDTNTVLKGFVEKMGKKETNREEEQAMLRTISTKLDGLVTQYLKEKAEREAREKAEKEKAELKKEEEKIIKDVFQK